MRPKTAFIVYQCCIADATATLEFFHKNFWYFPTRVLKFLEKMHIFITFHFQFISLHTLVKLWKPGTNAYEKIINFFEAFFSKLMAAQKLKRVHLSQIFTTLFDELVNQKHFRYGVDVSIRFFLARSKRSLCMAFYGPPVFTVFVTAEKLWNLMNLYNLLVFSMFIQLLSFFCQLIRQVDWCTDCYKYYKLQALPPFPLK